MGFQKAHTAPAPGLTSAIARARGSTRVDARCVAELAPGHSAVVTGVDGPGAIAVRLLEMGFVPGVRVHVVKRAPLGDPLELQLHGYHLSLRKDEARWVRVEAIR